ncbi:MAG: hypothetical protein QM770_01080 [Tepidisphaeraceae bacterium]
MGHPRRPAKNLLAPFHDRIVAWTASGLSLRQIAAQISAEGTPTDHNRVGRYCREQGIGITTKATGRPPKAAASAPAPKEEHAAPPQTTALVVRRRDPPPPNLPVLRKPSWLAQLVQPP